MSEKVINDGEIRKVLMTRESIISTATKMKEKLDRDLSKSEVSGLLTYMNKQNYNQSYDDAS